MHVQGFLERWTWWHERSEELSGIYFLLQNFVSNRVNINILILKRSLTTLWWTAQYFMIMSLMLISVPSYSRVQINSFIFFYDVSSSLLALLFVIFAVFFFQFCSFLVKQNYFVACFKNTWAVDFWYFFIQLLKSFSAATEMELMAWKMWGAFQVFTFYCKELFTLLES